ncbi:MAG: tyrosine recombinase XerC [Gaiellaceae bacterium]
MPSAWVRTRQTKAGQTRYRVEYRLGGRATPARYGGSFKRKTDADERKRWIIGELAARRVPDLRSLEPPTPESPSFKAAASTWLAARIDVSEGTRTQNRTSLNRAIPLIGGRVVHELTPQDIAAMISQLHEAGVRKSYLRKILQATAMTLDYAGRHLDNPARDKRFVKLPHEDEEEVNPPLAEHVLAAFRLLPPRYRLPLLILDDTGMRISELEKLEWGDIDEPRGRWRLRKSVTKTSRARWVTPTPVIFTAIVDLCPREDRNLSDQVLNGFSGDAFRTQLGRACTAAGIPLFSPHDLRHRRISLMHLRGVPWARIGEQVGQRSLAVTADTYTHVLLDETELDYTVLLKQDRAVLSSVPTKYAELAH